MNEIADALKSAWDRLPLGKVVGKQLRITELKTERAGIAACLSPAGDHGLIVALKAGEAVLVPAELDPTRTSTLSAEVAHFADSKGQDSKWLCVWCRDHSADGAFDSFCQLLCQKLIGQGLGASLLECYREFRSLLAEAPSAGGKTTGLLGELIFLSELLKADSTAVEAWAGPNEDRHDFRRRNVSVEVKTSIRSESQQFIVSVTSIDQLDPPAGGELYLQAYRLEQVAGGTFSLASLAKLITELADPAGKALFANRLESLGVQMPLSDEGYSMLASRAYHVLPEFPRLTANRLVSGGLDIGVSHVGYRLSLENAAKFEMACEEVRDRLARLVAP